MSWHFLTIGVGPLQHEKAALRLFREAEKSKLFTSCKAEDNGHLRQEHKEFFEQHKDFITHPLQERGFGNYVWKPYLLRYHLERIPEDHFLLYLDAGCALNLDSAASRKRMQEYFHITERTGSLLMQLKSGEFGINDLSEQTWTTSALMSKLNLNENHRKSNQNQAGIIFLQNNDLNRKIMGDWCDLSILDDYKYLKTTVIKLTNDDRSESRCEQSILSCLSKIHDLTTILDETYFYPNWKKDGKNFPIWAMRNRSGIDKRQSKILYRSKEIFAKIRDRASKGFEN